MLVTERKWFGKVITTKKVDEYLDLVDKNLKGFNNTTITGTVMMRHFSLVGNSNSFKSCMRMHTNTTGFIPWTKFDL